MQYWKFPTKEQEITQMRIIKKIKVATVLVENKNLISNIFWYRRCSFGNSRMTILLKKRYYLHSTCQETTYYIHCYGLKGRNNMCAGTLHQTSERNSKTTEMIWDRSKKVRQVKWMHITEDLHVKKNVTSFHLAY